MAAISVNADLADGVQRRRGVPQGCVLSLDLFSFYSEMIMRRIEGRTSFSVNGRRITYVRHADDIFLIGENEDTYYPFTGIKD